MQEKQTVENTNQKPGVAALSAGKYSPRLPIAHTRGHDKTRFAVPAVPRRPFRVCDRSLRRALRAVEQAVWLATGGDFLRS